MLKQIILISDGRSNVGSKPEGIAELALSQDIRVNTIGIINSVEDREQVLELESISEKGGGVCELTDLENLSETLSRVTMKSVYGTIEEVVNNELQDMMDVDIKEMNPKERNEITGMIDKLGDEIPLKTLILLDSSGSMNKKMKIAKKSIFELLMFLEERSGENQIGVMTFPGRNEDCELICDFTTEIDELRNKIEIIKTGGTTPTGPGIEGAIRAFSEEYGEYSLEGHIV